MTEPHPESLEAIATRLEDLRLALGYSSKAEFARNIDPEITPQKWNSYLSGTQIPIRVANIMCRKFKIDLNWLYHGDDSQLPHGLVTKLEAVKTLREDQRTA